ncbi:MAG: glycosyltransferase [Smithellaceae bacterium]|nr:glycosyltransferase [Smithellaceae bacterium]
MKSLLITPTFFPKPTGNAVTVERISRQLQQGGIECRIIDLSLASEQTLLEEVRRFAPDVIHAFHAFKSGPSGLRAKHEVSAAMITTMTGTDLNVDMNDPERKKVMEAVLSESAAITVFNEEAKALILQHGIPGGKISVIHQSVSLPVGVATDYRKRFAIDDDATVFLMLGSVRRIKNIGVAIDALSFVREKHGALYLLIAGPIMEQREFDLLSDKMKRNDWIHYLGEIARDEVCGLLREADVLLNTSLAESESNSLLEAMTCGRIVIGRNIPGNASILTKRTGILFNDNDDLRRKITGYIANAGNIELVRESASRLIEEKFNWQSEKDSYLSLYRNIAH